MEFSSGLHTEVKDVDTNKRTVLIKHSVYGSIDRVRDIAHPGMFAKTWSVLKPDFLMDHEQKSLIGSTLDNHEDKEGAYTKGKFGNWTLGNDALEMADAGVFKGASFGFVAEKKDYSNTNSGRVRNLREVRHTETSLLRVTPCHPDAGIVILTKAFEELEIKSLNEDEQSLLRQLLTNDQSSLQTLVALMSTIKPESDLYTWVGYQVSARADRMSSIMSQLKWNADQIAQVKSYSSLLDSYLKVANASDETQIMLTNENKAYKQLISDYDTAVIGNANQQAASDEGIQGLDNFLTKLNLSAKWQIPLSKN